MVRPRDEKKGERQTLPLPTQVSWLHVVRSVLELNITAMSCYAAEVYSQEFMRVGFVQEDSQGHNFWQSDFIK